MKIEAIFIKNLSFNSHLGHSFKGFSSLVAKVGKISTVDSDANCFVAQTVDGKGHGAEIK